MTGLINPDQESAQSSSNISTHAIIYDNDTICGIPPLCNRCDSSSDEESSADEDSYGDLPPLANRTVTSSDDDSSVDDSLFNPPPLMSQSISSSSDESTVSRMWEVETVISDSSYGTAHDDDASISTTESLFPSTFDDLGPPPPGCVMDLWDTPFSTSCLHNFASKNEDAKCYFFSSDTSDTESISDSSLEYPNDDDSYAEFNPILPHPVLSLTRVTAVMQLVGLDDGDIDFRPTISLTDRSGELIDTGGNFNMTNKLDHLVNIIRIKPFNVSMAAKEDKSTSFCTHRGDFPIPMLDGSTFYTPMYYNEQASDSILSPEAICYASKGLLKRWSQSGSVDDATGRVSFFNSKGAEVISLQLTKRNGLYYTPVSSIAVDNDLNRNVNNQCLNEVVYFHTPEGVQDDEVSIDFDDGKSPTAAFATTPSPPPSVNINTRRTLRGPTPSGPTMPPMTVPTPKSSSSLPFNPKYKQVEADLWQARLGHCSDWQMKVIPMSTTGTPAKFIPHPFASYDVYNQARIRKRPATKGKHPSRATTYSAVVFGFWIPSCFNC
jgi:hypothetical protein